MSYGIIEYDDQGNPICEICKKSFKRVMSHVRLKHNMNEREYKTKFGFDLIKGICSKESSALSREQTLKNYDKCIKRNLEEKGSKSRFKKGDKGRTKDQVSAQTRKRLKERFILDLVFIKSMQLSGQKLGLTGLGNKKRWNKNG